MQNAASVRPGIVGRIREGDGADHEVCGGTRTWTENHLRVRGTRTVPGLDIDLATIVDDAEAYAKLCRRRSA